MCAAVTENRDCSLIKVVADTLRYREKKFFSNLPLLRYPATKLYGWV